MKNEADTALDGVRVFDRAYDTKDSEAYYAAPVANKEMPWAFRSPDIVIVQRRPGGIIHECYAQVKYKTSKEGDRKWTDHEPKCIRAHTQETLECRCRAPWYRFDQLFWEMMGECEENPLITGNDRKTEILWCRWSDHPHWWRQNRPTVVEFYDRYLKWYWEGDRSPEATREIRRLVAEFNAETLKAAVDAMRTRDSNLFAKSRRGWIDIDALLEEWKPPKGEDGEDLMETCRRWSRMRARTAERSQKLSPALCQIARAAGLTGRTGKTEAQLAIQSEKVFLTATLLLRASGGAKLRVAAGMKRKATSQEA